MEEFASMARNKSIWGVFGIVLIITAVTSSIPLTLKGGNYLLGLPVAFVLLLVGVSLMVWAFRD